MSGPAKPAVGTYVKPPEASRASVPCRGGLTRRAVIGRPSGSWSLARTPGGGAISGWPASAVQASSDAIGARGPVVAVAVAVGVHDAVAVAVAVAVGVAVALEVAVLVEVAVAVALAVDVAVGVADEVGVGVEVGVVVQRPGTSLE